VFNLLNTELNPICHLLALLGARPIFHISRIRVNGCRQLSWPSRNCRQPQTYVKPEAAITVFELLMMSGMSLETCWAIKHWNNKFYYTVASCWLFLYDLKNNKSEVFYYKTCVATTLRREKYTACKVAQSR